MTSMIRDFTVLLPLDSDRRQQARIAKTFVADYADLEADWAEAGKPAFDEAFPNYYEGRYEQARRNGCLDLALSMYRHIMEQLEANFDAGAGDNAENWPRELNSVVLEPEGNHSGLWVKRSSALDWASSDVAIGIIRACQEHLGLKEISFRVRHGLRGEPLETLQVRVPPPGDGPVEIAPLPAAEPAPAMAP